MKKSITVFSVISLCLFSAFFLILSGTLHGEFKFREFKSDRDRFERYADEADKSINEQQWQNILDTGKQEMLADWERVAASELEGYIRKGFDDEEAGVDLEGARADWESEYEKAEAVAKGAWYVKREKLVFEDIDFLQLKEKVNDAGSSTGINDVPAWDSYVADALEGVNQAWDEKYLPVIAGLRSKGELLTGEEKAGFGAELEEFEKELRRKFEVERDTVLYTGRNIFINELYVDTGSLRYKSEGESADTVTEKVIEEVQGSLKEEEDRILNRTYSGEGADVIDFSSMGDNWQDELKRLVTVGMEKWNAALEKLYQKMLSWKQSAEEAYSGAEAMWRKAAEKLETAKLEWERKLSAEIYLALDNWKKEETELAENIDRSRRDFTGYMENLSSQWNDHSSGLIEMAVNGSKVYTEALDNIEWLQKMCNETANNTKGAYSTKGTAVKGVYNEDTGFWTILEQAERDRINNTISSLPGMDSISSRYHGIGYTDHQTGSMSYSNCSYYEWGEECTYNPLNGYLGHYYYTGDGFYTQEYAGSQELKDENGNWYLAETYVVRVYGKKMTYQAKSNCHGCFCRDRNYTYGWYESNDPVQTFTVTNNVTAASRNEEKSSCYYYKTELRRWEDIRNSFSQIASDAEVYMHEKDMLGDDGAGYLTKDKGENDPYLMTDAEFALETAQRDRDFWQKRLGIAKAVLDYAEAGKKESAETTEQRKIEAEKSMKDAKTSYERALGEVESIVENLKILQGRKPSTVYDPADITEEWKQYTAGIEYLTREYTEANKVLIAAEDEYTTIKRSIIVVENGENAGYLVKEIGELEKKIIQSDRELYLKNVELFTAQIRAENSGRTAGFAQNYETAVKDYEDSNFRFNTLKGILTGEENDESLLSWSIGIIGGKDKLWKENGEEYCNVLRNLVNEFNAASGDEKSMKRGELSAFIRGIYFTLQCNVESTYLIVSKLRDADFDPDAFMREEYTDDHAVSKKYADISVNALGIVSSAFKWAEDNNSKNYDSMLAWLKTEFGSEKYIYGADNTSWMEHYTALKYFEDRYRGLTAEAWESSRSRLEIDINYSEKASDLHEDITSMSKEDLSAPVSENELNASLGDMDAVAWLREYYMTGSGIAGIEFIQEIDAEALNSRRSYETVKAYVYENYIYFQKDQEKFTSHNYLQDMLGCINSIVSLGSAGENPFSTDAFKNMNPENMSLAAGALTDYIEKLEKSGMPVPDFLKTAAAAVRQAGEKLDQALFIYRYMTNDSSDEFAGTVDDVYSRKVNEAALNESLMEFMQNCEDVIISGTGTDYSCAMNILLYYESLSETEKKYLGENENEKIRGVDAFIRELYLYRYTININSIAADYSSAEVTPEQYADLTGLAGDERDRLITAIRPVYNRRIYDSAVSEGKVTDIKAYISSIGLDRGAEEELLYYALIKDFIKTHPDGNITPVEFTALDDKVKVYAASKYYYDGVFVKNGVMKTGIEEFLEDRFGDVDSGLVSAVENYAGRLNAITMYYGSDTGTYISFLDEKAAQYFLMYMNGADDSILPCFEYGIYGSNTAGSAVYADLGRITCAFDKFSAGFNDVAQMQSELLMIAQAGLKNAEALKALYAAGESEKNWRDSLIAVIEKNGDEEDAGIITLQPLDDLSGYFDSFDAETGMKNTLVYSSSPVTRDGKSFSLNSIIDEMNKISSVFTAVGESLKDGTVAAGDTKSIEQFLAEADGLYTFGSSYTPAGEGIFGFENSLNGLVSGYAADSDDLNSQASGIASEISGLDSGISGYKTTLGSKKASYNLLGGKTKEELLAQLEESRIKHETAKRDVEAIENSLTIAREAYEGINTDSVNKMNEVSSRYSSYKGLEFAYETAYSVWEYANTPYLKGTETDTGETGHGQTVEGTATDYSDIPVPDAKENYAEILAKFNQVNGVYNEKYEAVQNQDTVEKLNRDAEYVKLKESFVQMSETYIRTSQVDVEVKDDLEQYKTGYNLSQKAYENSKDQVDFYRTKFAGLDDETEKAALKELRDKLLAHILKTGTGGVAVLNTYMKSLAYYSCVISTQGYLAEIERLLGLGYPDGLGAVYNLHERISSNKKYVNAFNSLSEEVRNDIKTIYESFRTGGDNPGKILTGFHQYIYWQDMYEEADHEYSSTSKWNKPRRRKWKNKRNSREAKRNSYRAQYVNGRDSVRDSLNDTLAKKNDYAQKSAAYAAISSARYIDDIKAYLKQGQYSLTDEDLNHLYDSTSTGYVPDSESINLDLLRNETERKDLDGAAVKAKAAAGKIVVLDKDGKETEETFDLTDASVKLKLGDEYAETFEEGVEYRLFDRTYSIAAVTGVMKQRAETIRKEYCTALMTYAGRSVADGRHDNTVILRDLESTYHSLQGTAVNFNSGTVDAKGKPVETGQRRFDGYTTITKEYVKNGAENSIEGMIVQALIKQSTALQNQLWQQQITKFGERKNRWKEVAGYILNRGTQEWRENYAAFKTQWAKWRFEARKQIEEGEQWWTDLKNTMTGDMNTWADNTSGTSTKEAAQRIYSDLETQIGTYEESIKKKTGVSFNIDTDSILKQAMKNNPVDSIGILCKSMFAADTTAGFTNMLNLGLSGALFRYNEEQMKQYTNAMAVMKNLRMIDILNGIIDGFNTQLSEANKNVYKGVRYNIAGNETFSEAPFERKESEHRWEIEVCTESNLTGDKYKSRKFSDYNYYINSTVLLKPVKGINGAEIDFTQAYTYSNVDESDLETYVGLESEWLNRSIEEVFKEGGTFTSHQSAEYTRLFDSFGKYYGDWAAGEALKSGAFYSKPVFPGGPNMLQTAAIAASLTGCPIAIIAVNLATTGLQVADGSLAWEHAAVQFGVGAASSMSGSLSPLVQMASSGIVYEEGGGIGWSDKQFKQGVKDGAVRLGVQAIIGNNPILTETVMSGMETDGKWYELGFDNDNWMQHITTGLAAGISQGVGAASGSNVLGQFVQQGIMTGMYNLTGGKGFKTDYSNFNWNVFNQGAGQLGNMFGSMAKDWLVSKFDSMADEHRDRGENGLPSGSGALDYLDDLLGGLWQGLRESDLYKNGIIASIAVPGEGLLDNPGSGDEPDVMQGGAAGLVNFRDSINAGMNGVTGAMSSSFVDFGEGAWNFVSGNGFNTDEELAAFNRIQESIANKTALAAGSSDYYKRMYAVDPGSLTSEDYANWQLALQVEHRSDEAQLVMAASWQTDDQFVFDDAGGMYEGANSEAVKYIMEKHANGEKITADDLKELTKTMLQKSTLPKEVLETIENDPEAFKQLAGRTFDFGKKGTMTLNFDDPESIKKYAENISKVYCVAASLYGQMVVNGIDGTPGSFGEFTKQLIEKGLINPDKPARQIKSTQTIIDAFAGKGQYEVVRFDKSQSSGTELLNKLRETAIENKDIKFFNVRINSPHNMNLYNENGDLKIYDTSDRGFGVSIYVNTRLIKPSNIKSWYYIRQIRRR